MSQVFWPLGATLAPGANGIVQKSYPSVQLSPSETNGEYQEIREIGGDLWIVTNAQYNETLALTPLAAGAWGQVLTTAPSYALVLKASAGTITRFTAAAAGGPTLTAITFIQTPLVIGQGSGSTVDLIQMWNSLTSGVSVWAINNVGWPRTVQPVRPGGRLTLTTAVPVMIADVSLTSTVFYTPYQTGSVPIFDGTLWLSVPFSEVSLVMTAARNVSGNNYDVFGYLVAGVFTIGTGPAWSTTVVRGTGAGTTQISLVNGVWSNTVSITCWNNGVSTVVPAGQATYLGTINCNGTAQVTMTGLAGTNPIAAGNFLGLYNAYNKVTVQSKIRDNGAAYAVAVATTWQAAQNNTNIRVTVVDGLQQSNVWAHNAQDVAALATFGARVGVDLDSVVNTPSLQSVTLLTGGTALETMLQVDDYFSPQLGLHFYQAMVLATSNVLGNVNFNTNFAGSFIVRVEI